MIFSDIVLKIVAAEYRTGRNDKIYTVVGTDGTDFIQMSAWKIQAERLAREIPMDKTVLKIFSVVTKKIITLLEMKFLGIDIRFSKFGIKRDTRRIQSWFTKYRVIV